MSKKICDIEFNFENDKFYIEYTSCGDRVENLRQESEILATKIYKVNPNIIVSLSSGLDGQIVLHSFCSQSIPVKAAFMYLPGYNEVEFERIKILESKYNVEFIIKEFNPENYKEELLAEYELTKIPPYQLLHKKFLASLPEDHTFIQGIDGPDFYYQTDKWIIIQTANSYVNSRTRGFRLLNRSGQIVNWERNSTILLSILKDDIVSAFLCAYNNIVNNDLVYTGGKTIPIIDHYDLYIKPFIYAKYWKDELEYFPKYQGCEEIDWVMNNKWHQYRENLITISLSELMQHLGSEPGSVRRFYQRS